jgi:hypothetical protein
VTRVSTDDDWDDNDEAFTDDSGAEETTIPCPYCQRSIHEDSVRCPHCENYISREDVPVSHKPWWILLGAVACVFVIYCWMVR